ncbi:MAG: hypothetical protein ACOC93_03465 [Planctomycetota bacterium]
MAAEKDAVAGGDASRVLPVPGETDSSLYAAGALLAAVVHPQNSPSAEAPSRQEGAAMSPAPPDEAMPTDEPPAASAEQAELDTSPPGATDTSTPAPADASSRPSKIVESSMLGTPEPPPDASAEPVGSTRQDAAPVATGGGTCNIFHVAQWYGRTGRELANAAPRGRHAAGR